MILILLPLPSFFSTDALSCAVAMGLMKPAEEPSLVGMSGVTTLRATKAGRIFWASFPEVVPSFFVVSVLPQAASSGIPPATAAVATAVEARKLLRLGAEGEFGVIASTLHGAPGHTAGAAG